MKGSTKLWLAVGVCLLAISIYLHVELIQTCLAAESPRGRISLWWLVPITLGMVNLILISIWSLDIDLDGFTPEIRDFYRAIYAPVAIAVIYAYQGLKLVYSKLTVLADKHLGI